MRRIAAGRRGVDIGPATSREGRAGDPEDQRLTHDRDRLDGRGSVAACVPPPIRTIRAEKTIHQPPHQTAAENVERLGPGSICAAR